jgi:hypothetical protein
VGVEVGVSLPLKPIDKPQTLCEVGEVGVVQQVDKLRPEQTKNEERRKR